MWGNSYDLWFRIRLNKGIETYEYNKMAGHETEELIIAYRSKSESKIVYLVIMQMILVLCTISPFNSFIYLKNQKGCLHFKAVVIAFRGKWSRDKIRIYTGKTMRSGLPVAKHIFSQTIQST